jgi:hypothetical protein
MDRQDNLPKNNKYIVNKVKSVELSRYDGHGYYYYISKNGEVAKECMYESGKEYYTEIGFEHDRQVFIADSVKEQLSAYCAEMEQTASDAILLTEGFCYSAFEEKPLIWRLYGYKEKLPIYEFFCFGNDGSYWYFLDSVYRFFDRFSFENYAAKGMAEGRNVEYFTQRKEKMPLIESAERVGDNYLALELKWLLGIATIKEAEYLTGVDGLARFVPDAGIYDPARIVVKSVKLCHSGTQISGIKTYYSLSCLIDGKSYMAEWREGATSLAVLSYNRNTNIAVSEEVVEQIAEQIAEQIKKLL